MVRDDESIDPGGERHPEWERLRDEHGLGEVDHLAEVPGYRPRPDDHLVEPLFGGLFGALVEEHAEVEVVEVVEDELEDGRRVSRLAQVWRRVRLFWRR